jgi:hypothetical protein
MKFGGRCAICPEHGMVALSSGGVRVCQVREVIKLEYILLCQHSGSWFLSIEFETISFLKVLGVRIRAAPVDCLSSKFARPITTY